MAERISKFKQALRDKQTKKKDAPTNEGFFDKKMKQFQEETGERHEGTEDKGLTKGKIKSGNNSEDGKEISGAHKELASLTAGAKPVRGRQQTKDLPKQRKRGTEKGNILEEILQTSQRLNSAPSHTASKTEKKDSKIKGKDIHTVKSPVDKRKEDDRDGKITKDIVIDDDVISTVGIFNTGRSSKLIQRDGKKGVSGAKEKVSEDKRAPKHTTKGDTKQDSPDSTAKPKISTTDEPEYNVFNSIRQELQNIALSKDTKLSQTSKKIREIEDLLFLADFDEIKKKHTEQAEANSKLLCEVDELSDTVRSLSESIQFAVAKRKLDFGERENSRGLCEESFSTREFEDPPSFKRQKIGPNLLSKSDYLSPFCDPITPPNPKKLLSPGEFLSPLNNPLQTPFRPNIFDESTRGTDQSFKYDPSSPFIQPLLTPSAPALSSPRPTFLSDLFYQ